MVDVTALEEAGFQRVYATTQDWEQAQEALAKSRKYGSSDVQVPYVLERGAVVVAIEQNTQEQTPFGVPTTVHYPEVAIVQNSRDGRRAACDAKNTNLILQIADELARPAARERRNHG